MSDILTASDDELIAGITRGEAAAFAALFARRHKEVFRFALHMTGAAAVAEDVTQEVFLAVMNDAGRYVAGRASVLAWLCGIARNHARRRFDQDRRIVPLGQPRHEEGDDGYDLPAVHPDPVADLAREERVEAVRRAVLSLPIHYREVVVLCDLQEMSYGDAASALECAVGTVRSRLHRGRTLLASKLRLAEDSSTSRCIA